MCPNSIARIWSNCQSVSLIIDRIMSKGKLSEFFCWYCSDSPLKSCWIWTTDLEGRLTQQGAGHVSLADSALQARYVAGGDRKSKWGREVVWAPVVAFWTSHAFQRKEKKCLSLSSLSTFSLPCELHPVFSSLYPLYLELCLRDNRCSINI